MTGCDDHGEEKTYSDAIIIRLPGIEPSQHPLSRSKEEKNKNNTNDKMTKPMQYYSISTIALHIYTYDNLI